MEKHTVVSYYTDEEVYGAGAARLRASAEKYGYACRIEKLMDMGDWLLNIAYKPPFISKMLKKHGPAWWLDADAWLVKPLPDMDCDLAFRMSRNAKPHGSAMYFADTPGAFRAISLWKSGLNWVIKHRGQHPKWHDEHALRRIMHNFAPEGIRVKILENNFVKCRERVVGETVRHEGTHSKKRSLLPRRT